MCPQNQKILSTNHHYGNPSTRFSVEPKKSSPLTIAFGSKKFAGTEGMGRGYHVHATGEFLASGEYFDQMKANFPWLRKVLVVHVTDVEQKI